MEKEEKWGENRYCCRYSIWRCIGFIILGILGFTIFAVLIGFVIMWLWNWLVPEIFHGGMISFWQAVGIAVLARLIFGGCHHGWYNHARRCNSWRYHKHYRNCNNYKNRWYYYEKYWEEEGEKSFNEYVKKVTEKDEKPKE